MCSVPSLVVGAGRAAPVRRYARTSKGSITPVAGSASIVKWNVPFYFGGTSLMIIVVVTMDFMAQVKAYVMSHQYESLLKKANFKGGVFPTR